MTKEVVLTFGEPSGPIDFYLQRKRFLPLQALITSGLKPRLANRTISLREQPKVGPQKQRVLREVKRIEGVLFFVEHSPNRALKSNRAEWMRYRSWSLSSWESFPSLLHKLVWQKHGLSQGHSSREEGDEVGLFSQILLEKNLKWGY